MFQAIALLVATAGSRPGETVEDVLNHVRRALGPAPAHPVWLSGKAVISGVEGSYTLRFDGQGRFRQAVRGALGETFGFDGRTMWKRDFSGAPKVIELEDEDLELAVSRFAISDWADPGQGCRFKLLSDDADAATLRMDYGDNDFEETVKVDKRHWLPVSASFIFAGDGTLIDLADWQKVDGRTVPFKVAVESEGLTNSYRISRADEVDQSESNTFEFPSWSYPEVRFIPGVPSAVECKRLLSGHFAVHPLINGQDAGWFIFDSGAGTNCIDPKVADSLGLMKIGSDTVTGVGGTVATSYRPSRTFQLGPAEIRDITFTEIDLAAIGRALGIKLAGIVGTDTLLRVIVEFNAATAQISVYDPKNYELPSGNWQDLHFDSDNPAVTAHVDNLPPALFRIDTGDPGTITFHAPYVIQNNLLKDRKTTGALSGGVGGATSSRAGKIDQFMLGGVTFTNLPATFSTATKGAFDTNYLAGNVGDEVLRKFLVVFDFGGRRIAFLPQTPPGASTFGKKR